MKKILSTIILTITLSAPVLAVFPSSPAYAVDVLNTQCNSSTLVNHAGCDGACNDPYASSKPTICDPSNNATHGSNPLYGPTGILTTIFKLFSYIIGVTAIIVIIIAAITFVTSGGDSSKVGKARSAVLYALIGIVVAGLSQVLAVFVLNKV